VNCTKAKIHSCTIRAGRFCTNDDCAYRKIHSCNELHEWIFPIVRNPSKRACFPIAARPARWEGRASAHCGRLAAGAGLDLGDDIAGEALRCPAPGAERADCRVTPSS
jgi:hypothetical protein